MGMFSKKKRSKSGRGLWGTATDLVGRVAQQQKDAIAASKQEQARADGTAGPRTAEDFGAVDVDDFESFEGANVAALRDAHSNQRRQFTASEGIGDEEADEGDDADVRIGDDADLSGSRKRKRSPTGAAGTSSLSPSIRI